MATYPGEYEILIGDNDSSEQATLGYFAALRTKPRLRLLLLRGPFHDSAINNAGAREALGDVLIFLNNDTVMYTQDWCTELVGSAIREDVGAVGTRLLYADGTIQQAGVLLGVEGVAGHESVGETPESGRYCDRTRLFDSAAAVTGACLAPRDAFWRWTTPNVPLPRFPSLKAFKQPVFLVEIVDNNICHASLVTRRSGLVPALVAICVSYAYCPGVKCTSIAVRVRESRS